MRISDALLMMIYRNNNKMTLHQISGYITRLIEYDMLEINEGEFSVSLSEMGLNRLHNRGLLSNGDEKER